MAKYGIVGYGILQKFLENLKVIYTFTGKYPLAEKILIDV